MKTNKDRQRHFETFRSPTPDEKAYASFEKWHDERMKSNPKFRKESKVKYAQACSTWKTQSMNGIGLLQDSELRYFHDEFNERAWKYGFGAMPASFNVLEGFYNWNPDLFYFELFDEEEHLISFFDFVDFMTSNNCSDSIDYFTENVSDDLIYSYNILNEVQDITFKTKDSKEYVIGGVSFIKRSNEVTMLIVAGELGNTDIFTQQLPDISEGTKTKSYLKPAENRKREAVKLFDRNDIWKVNVYIRIDLNTKTIDSRYIQKDNGDSFSTITDDVGMFVKSIKTELLDDLIKQQLEEIENYEAIFEIAYKCLYLPEYFDFNNDITISEEHPTGLVNEKIKSKIFRGDVTFNSKYFHKTKDVWVIDKDFKPQEGTFIVKQQELKVQKEGYWKKLEPGQVGKDKNGNNIHNRTWIQQTLSWYETTKSTNLKITIPKKISANSGFIYLLRNASHDLDIFKIGLTTKTVEERAKQLSGTGSPDQFIVIKRWHTADCILAERIIHEKLDKFRLNPKREFFKIDLEHAISVISPVIKEINSNGT